MGQYLQGLEKEIPAFVEMKGIAVEVTWRQCLENAILSSLQSKQVGASCGWEHPGGCAFDPY